MSQLRFALQEHFEVEVRQDAHSKQNRYAFGPRRDDTESAQSKPNEPAEAEEPVEVLAGFAGFERGKL